MGALKLSLKLSKWVLKGVVYAIALFIFLVGVWTLRIAIPIFVNYYL